MDIQFTPQLLHSSTHTVLSFTKINTLEKKMGYEQSLLDQPKKIIIKTKQNKNKSLNLILISREGGVSA